MVHQLHVIVGPTGSGKTDLSLDMAVRYSCPIIGADSRQIYRDLPIGTAAPTPNQRAIAPHYLVGFKSLTDTYNAGQFARDAEQLLEQFFETYDHVVLVGGSMLYVEALCTGLDAIPAVNDAVRTQVQISYRQQGLDWLQTQVQTLDPVYWETVDRFNPQRLMHALAVSLTAGKPYSSFLGQKSIPHRNYSIQWHQVECPREELYRRINLRVERMMEQGLEQEALEAFHTLGVSLNPSSNSEPEVLPNSVNTVGYKELLTYFRGQCTREQAIAAIQQNTRHYAKRQMTWWRNRRY